MKIRINQTGDTIVEVMIAIVILSAALGGAFAIANKSTLNTQSNHERYQAQLYANQQVELLRQAYANHMVAGTRDTFAMPASALCLDRTSANWLTNATSCTIDSLYHITVTHVTSVPVVNVASGDTVQNDLTYRVRVTWDTLGGGASNTEVLYGL